MWYHIIEFPQCTSFKPIQSGNCISVLATIDNWNYKTSGIPADKDSVLLWKWFKLSDINNLEKYNYVKEDLLKHKCK